MKNSFKSAVNDLYGVRHYGSSVPSLASEPYTSGTFYIWFASIPVDITRFLQTSDLNYDDIPKALSAFCTGVTPPGGTLNKVEYTGVGGVKWAVPGSIDYGTSLTLKFVEYQWTPILDIFSAWTRLIRDNRTGISNIPKDRYEQRNYSATMLYWTTTPNAMDVQFYCAFDGVYPLKDPMDLYTSDVETVDKLEIDMEFNVNRPIRDKWVYDVCVAKTSQMQGTHQQIIKTLEGSGKGYFK